MPKKVKADTPVVIFSHSPIQKIWHQALAGGGRMPPPACRPRRQRRPEPKPDPLQGQVQSFTLLAGASPEQKTELVDALYSAGWVQEESQEQRAGGLFRELRPKLPDGRRGTVSVWVERG